jgi:hypothetical protein
MYAFGFSFRQPEHFGVPGISFDMLFGLGRLEIRHRYMENNDRDKKQSRDVICVNVDIQLVSLDVWLNHLMKNIREQK